MRYIYPFLLFILILPALHSQTADCQIYWDGEKSDDRWYIGGRIDNIHAYCMFLCIKNNKVKGNYEMITSKKKIEVEGFIKGDSIFMAEYSPGQKVLGLIKGHIRQKEFTANLYNTAGTFTGNMNGRIKDNPALCKQIESTDFAKIVLYLSAENPAQRMLISYPNEYACKGILYDADQQKTFYMSGRKPQSKESQYKISTLTKPVSAGKLTCTLREDEFIQSTFPGRKVRMMASRTIPLKVTEKSDRRSSYEIHFPYANDKNADKFIGEVVNSIQHEFDSVYTIVAKKTIDDEPFARTTDMTAWFEPTFVSKNWLCGHFIIHYSGMNISRVLAFNYNYLWNKSIDIEDLINVKNSKDILWNNIISNQNKTTGKEKTPVNEVWDSPAICYRGLLLSTPFDRLYDRRLYQTQKDIKGIKWKWWKPDYWLYKFHQI